MAMAEFHYASSAHQALDNHPYLLNIGTTASMMLGLCCISFPEYNQTWTWWSNGMCVLATYVFPPGIELARYWPGLGAQLICVAFMLNPNLKRILSGSLLNWMGNVSFAVYLIHGTLIRTVLTWAVFGFSTQRPPYLNEDNESVQDWIEPVATWKLIVVIPLFYILVYRLANYWVKYVDPWAGAVTNWIEARVAGTLEDEKAKANALV